MMQRIAVIGAGKIAIGPLIEHAAFADKKIFLFARASGKWHEAVQKGMLYKINERDGTTHKIPVFTEFEEALSSENAIVLIVYNEQEIFKKVIPHMQAVIISVGEAFPEIVSCFPDTDCPIILIENNYDQAIELMKKEKGKKNNLPICC